jgi:uncharacterized protein YndB with AHSA1/START domain
MNAEPTRSIVVERLIPYPAEKIWRALTVPELLAEWLMQNDFTLQVGHRFTFRAKPVPGWSGVVNCEVVEMEEPRLLSYRWGDGTESDTGLRTLVTWTLTAVDGGTLVRMEHSGFRPVDDAGYRGMGAGWPGILQRLERAVAALD